MTSVGNWEYRNIDIDSDEIFEALRIPDKKGKRELLDNAKRVDYIGSESVEEVRSQLSCHGFPYLSGSPTAMVDEGFSAMAGEDFFPQREEICCLMFWMN